MAILDATPSMGPRLIGVRWNEIVSLDLTSCVAQTKSVGARLDERDYDAVIQLRGASIAEVAMGRVAQGGSVLRPCFIFLTCVCLFARECSNSPSTLTRCGNRHTCSLKKRSLFLPYRSLRLAVPLSLLVV